MLCLHVLVFPKFLPLFITWYESFVHVSSRVAHFDVCSCKFCSRFLSFGACLNEFFQHFLYVHTVLYHFMFVLFLHQVVYVNTIDHFALVFHYFAHLWCLFGVISHLFRTTGFLFTPLLMFVCISVLHFV